MVFLVFLPPDQKRLSVEAGPDLVAFFTNPQKNASTNHSVTSCPYEKDMADYCDEDYGESEEECEEEFEEETTYTSELY